MGNSVETNTTKIQDYLRSFAIFMGKIYNFTDAEVKWYTITNGPNHYFITLCTKSKRMWINSYSPNYRQVKKLVWQKYQEWEHYAGGN